MNTRILGLALEPERACCACQKEHGITPAPNTSHGYCRRHLLANWVYLVEMAEARGRAETAAAHRAKIIELMARPESDFPPDLATCRPGDLPSRPSAAAAAERMAA